VPVWRATLRHHDPHRRQAVRFVEAGDRSLRLGRLTRVTRVTRVTPNNLHDLSDPNVPRSRPPISGTDPLHPCRGNTMKYLSVAALLVAGLIHLLPVPGVLGVGALARLYGIAVTDPNTAILLQHRALLFGVLGVFMLCAVGLPSLRVAALTVGLVSAASFIGVALWVGGYNAAIGRVVIADVVASILLAVGLAAELSLAPSRRI
jgi:hypothetical protein